MVRFFYQFHALSFGRNFFRPEFPFKSFSDNSFGNVKPRQIFFLRKFRHLLLPQKGNYHYIFISINMSCCHPFLDPTISLALFHPIKC